jgi:hypothetical protein
MSEELRLTLIMEAITYCKKVKSMGMPPAAFSKALREPIYYLWELRYGNKNTAPKYRSKNALNLRFGKDKIVYDHAIPFNYLLKILLSDENLTIESLRLILNKHCVCCIITIEENRILNSFGLKDKMPKGWDENECLARYRVAGIETIENPLTKSYTNSF